MNRSGPLQHAECKCGTDCVWLRGATIDNGKPRPAWLMVEAASVEGDTAEDFESDRRGFPMAPPGAVIHDPVACEEKAGADSQG